MIIGSFFKSLGFISLGLAIGLSLGGFEYSIYLSIVGLIAVIGGTFLEELE